MTAFALGDLVLVARQPKDMIVRIVGEVGVIESLTSTYASITCLKLDGSMSGGGGVLLDCLEHEVGPHWMRAKEIWYAKFEQLKAEGIAQTERYRARMAELSAKYGISVENVKALYSDIVALNNRGWWS
jgi:hypothetical protein